VLGGGRVHRLAIGGDHRILKRIEDHLALELAVLCNLIEG
jgi:hypothetical protein